MWIESRFSQIAKSQVSFIRTIMCHVLRCPTPPLESRRLILTHCISDLNACLDIHWCHLHQFDATNFHHLFNRITPPSASLARVFCYSSIFLGLLLLHNQPCKGQTGRQISFPEAQATSTPMAQASAILSMPIQSQIYSEKCWAVVIQGLDQSYTLKQVCLQHTDCGESIWRDIRQQIRHKSLATSMTSLISMLLTRTVVGTGSVQKVEGPQLITLAE